MHCIVCLSKFKTKNKKQLKIYELKKQKLFPNSLNKRVSWKKTDQIKMHLALKLILEADVPSHLMSPYESKRHHGLHTK